MRGHGVQTVSPDRFATRALLAAWAPWMVLGLIILGLGLVAAHVTHGSPVLHVLGVALLFLCTGGVALGYAAAWMHLIYRGLLPVPRVPWRVALRQDGVHIATDVYETLVPLAELARVVHLEDDAWDQMRGMETHCLVLHRRRGARISVPGSSQGFAELYAELRRTMDVERTSA